MFQKYIDGQYRRPAGPVGRWVGRKMAQQHRPENLWTVTLLDVQPTDHVLEIGFGPGIAIHEVANRATAGLVVGIDFSEAMVRAARQRNAEAILARRVDLRHGDAAHLPFLDDVYDKAFSIHSIYFWPKPLDALKEIHRVLLPGGTMILTILPKERWSPSDAQGDVGAPECRPYSGDELQQFLAEAGFAQIHIEADSNPKCPSNYSVIGLK